MCSTSYIVVVHESIPFTQNIVVSDADHTSEGTDMDALGPHRPIQRMVVTDGLEKTKQQGEKLKKKSRVSALPICCWFTGTLIRHLKKVILNDHL